MRRLQITVELVPGGEPIRGHVCGEAATRSFSGWMELISALQASIEEAQSHVSDPGRGADGRTHPNKTPED
jgi:hypothetical protein